MKVHRQVHVVQVVLLQALQVLNLVPQVHRQVPVLVLHRQVVNRLLVRIAQ